MPSLDVHYPSIVMKGHWLLSLINRISHVFIKNVMMYFMMMSRLDIFSPI